MLRHRKILFVLVGVYDGGQERSALSLIEALVVSGHQVGLLLVKHQPDIVDRLPSGLTVHYCLHGSARIRYKLIGIIHKIRQVACNYDVIVGATDLDANYLAMVGGLLARRPVIGWVHSHYVSFARNLGVFHRLFIRIFYPLMNRIVMVHPGNLIDYKPLEGVPHCRKITIPNMFNLKKIQRLSNEAMIKESCGWYKLPVILGIGRLESEKNFELLIRAHSRLRIAGFEHNLVILGEGSLRGQLQELAVKLKVEQSVYLPGFVDNPYPLLKRATIFALSSDFEGLSRVMIEAMVLGVSIVATDCPTGPREILAGGKCGVLVNPGNEDEFVARLSELLNDTTRRLEYLISAKKRAEDFSIKKILPIWENLLSELSN